jgi:hypothetical protein
MWQTPTLVNWRKMFTLGTPDGNAEEDHFAYASPEIREFLALNRQMSKVTTEGVQAMVATARQVEHRDAASAQGSSRW